MPAYAPRRQPLPLPAESNQFMRWIGDLLHADDAKAVLHNENYDFVLDDAAVTMAGGVEPGRIFVLGVPQAVGSALTAIAWKTAALVRQHKNRDWIALAAKDVRVKGSTKSANPVPIRLWIPVSAVVMDTLGSKNPKTLRIREIEVVNGLPTAESDQPSLMDIPMSMKGKWTVG